MNSYNDTLIIIPARLGSARLSNKLMREINGKPILQHTYDQAKKSGIRIIVATPDIEIYNFILEQLNGEAIITGHHDNGTNRCIEAYNSLSDKNDYRYLINVQADEPMIDPEILIQLAERLARSEGRSCDIATVAYTVHSSEKLSGNSEVFIVKNKYDEALYFSRSIIPFIRDQDRSEWTKNHTYLRHLGVYGFNTSVLHELRDLPESVLEQVEKLEQLKWLEHGFRIGLIHTDKNMHSIDTLEDFNYVQSILKK